MRAGKRSEYRGLRGAATCGSFSNVVALARYEYVDCVDSVRVTRTLSNSTSYADAMMSLPTLTPTLTPVLLLTDAMTSLPVLTLVSLLVPVSVSGLVGTVGTRVAVSVGEGVGDGGVAVHRRQRGERNRRRLFPAGKDSQDLTLRGARGDRAPRGVALAAPQVPIARLLRPRRA
jgi:hypothetical protein